MKKQQIKAFTLVELIIVITILAILAIIGFISYQSYTLDARDSSRVTSLKEISSGLEIYQTKNASLPDPDDQKLTTLDASGNVLSVQGYVGFTLHQKIRLTSDVSDPSDDTYYTYSTNGEKTKYQLLALLEKKGTNISFNSSDILNKTYASQDYTNRYRYTLGKIVGIYFSGTTNIPLQETRSGTIMIGGINTPMKVLFSNDSNNSGTITGTGTSLLANIGAITKTDVVSVSPTKSCTMANGTGSQTWDGTSWGSCTAISCNSGYQLTSGICARSCNSYSTCYAISDSYVFHSVKGLLTKISGLWQASDATYLGLHYETWFPDTNYATNTYYYEYSQYTKIDHRRVDNNQIRGTIIGTPNNRIREVGNSSRRAACCNGRAGGVPKSQTNPCYYGTSQIYQPWGNYRETATTTSCYNTTTGWIN